MRGGEYTSTTDQSIRFLIVRLSAIGDTIHTLPLAAALRRHFPGAGIGWVVETPSAPLIIDNPAVDWVKVMPKGWLKSPSLVRDLRRVLREQRFDTVFDVQGLSKSSVAAYLSGAKTRIGFTRGEAREIAPILDNRLIRPYGRHAVDLTLSLLGGVDRPVPDQAEFPLPPCPDGDRAAIDDALSPPAPSRGFVLMGPWGSFPSKLWPLERFGELAMRLRERIGLSSLMLGHGDRERARVRELSAATDGALAIAPDVSPVGVAELARKARLFVGCDSFPMHAAAAVECPTLGLFGVTDPARLGPYGPSGKSVFEKITLVESTRARRRLGPENMLALGVDKVLRSCLNMLKVDF